MGGFLPVTLFYFEMQHRKCVCWSLLTSQLKAAAGNWSVCTFSSVEVTSVDTRHHRLWLLPPLLLLLLFSLLMELKNHSEPVHRMKKSQVEFKWILAWSPVIVWVSPVGTSEVSFYLRSKKDESLALCHLVFLCVCAHGESCFYNIYIKLNTRGVLFKTQIIMYSHFKEGNKVIVTYGTSCLFMFIYLESVVFFRPVFVMKQQKIISHYLFKH